MSFARVATVDVHGAIADGGAKAGQGFRQRRRRGSQQRSRGQKGGENNAPNHAPNIPRYLCSDKVDYLCQAAAMASTAEAVRIARKSSLVLGRLSGHTRGMPDPGTETQQRESPVGR
jgi:hypothetical protein